MCLARLTRPSTAALLDVVLRQFPEEEIARRLLRELRVGGFGM
jgi:hypothetical protein